MPHQDGLTHSNLEDYQKYLEDLHNDPAIALQLQEARSEDNKAALRRLDPTMPEDLIGKVAGKAMNIGLMERFLSEVERHRSALGHSAGLNDDTSADAFMAMFTVAEGLDKNSDIVKWVDIDTNH